MWMLYAQEHWTKSYDLKSAVERLYEELGALEFDADHEAIYGMERYYTVQQCEELRDKYKIGKKNTFAQHKHRRTSEHRLFEPCSYNPRLGGYINRVWQRVDKTQHLNPKTPEDILVGALINHVNYEIETIIISAQVNTIDELVTVLEQLENRNDSNNRPTQSVEYNTRTGYNHNSNISGKSKKIAVHLIKDIGETIKEV
ncbi:hypothetical protein FQA39_LY11539 [Lamprigera yunnana]|nr:hypothetical protein FQA39_LY11539 [Lamprigera yunnana]